MTEFVIKTLVFLAIIIIAWRVAREVCLFLLREGDNADDELAKGFCYLFAVLLPFVLMTLLIIIGLEVLRYLMPS